MIYKPKAESVAPSPSSPPASLALETPYGEMLFPADCKVVTPAVAEHGIWAAEDCLLLQTLLRSGDVMIDVGAHCGFLTLAGAHAVGPSGRIISVEPAPQSAALLRNNVESLSPAPVAVLELAAWSGPGHASLSVNQADSTATRAFSVSDPSFSSGPQVELAALDALLSHQLDRLDLIKLRASGSESFALQGMIELCKRFRPALLVDFSPQALDQAGSSSDYLLELLRSLDYQLRVPGAIGFADAPDELIQQVAELSPTGSLAILALPASPAPSTPQPAPATAAQPTPASRPASDGPLDLTDFELKVHSQNGEDGVIAELIDRVGAPGRFFVEFGAERGSEGNCVLLAQQGWSGLLIEGSPESFAHLEARYQDNPQVTTLQAMITADSLQDLLRSADVPAEPDVFSIDIDSNDFYIFESLTDFSPRILIIEYNADLPLDRKLVMPRDDSHSWDGTDYYGASIAALRHLADQKGYTLVHTEACGVNAFFVRNDLMPNSGLPSGSEVPLRKANHFHTGKGHPRDPQDRPFIDLDLDRPVRLSQSI